MDENNFQDAQEAELKRKQKALDDLLQKMHMMNGDYGVGNENYKPPIDTGGPVAPRTPETMRAEQLVAESVGTADVGAWKATDADTFQFDDNTPVRLSNADAPETEKFDAPAQPFGDEAHDFVNDIFANKDPTVVQEAGDGGFGRGLAKVKYQEDGVEKDLGEELLKKGLAQLDPRFHDDPHLQALEAQARANKVGLWSDVVSSSVTPKEWRNDLQPPMRDFLSKRRERQIEEANEPDLMQQYLDQLKGTGGGADNTPLPQGSLWPPGQGGGVMLPNNMPPDSTDVRGTSFQVEPTASQLEEHTSLDVAIDSLDNVTEKFVDSHNRQAEMLLRHSSTMESIMDQLDASEPFNAF